MKPSPVSRHVAPPMRLVGGGDIITRVLEMIALHLRCTVPALSSFTLDELDQALADLRPQLVELLDIRVDDDGDRP
jgi:hypothetical protein